MFFCAGALISILFTGCNDLKQDKQQPQPVQVSNVELAATLSLEVGEKQTLTATVLPADAENRTVSWKSEDASIATVSSSGEVTAAGAGTTTITATANGGKTASCTVTVTAKSEPELQWVNLDYVFDEFAILIIDSDEELKKYVEGDYPPIDFSKKTLVLAYGYFSGGFDTEDYKFQQVSDRNYVFTLYGYGTGMTGYIRWHDAIIVDKLPSDSKIELKIEMIKP